MVSIPLSCQNKPDNPPDRTQVRISHLSDACRLTLLTGEASVLNNLRCAQEAEYRHGGRKDCLRGTRRAILDEIEAWSKDPDKPSVYWLNGLAGTGKTTIAQTTSKRLFAGGQLGASFFCSRDFEDRSNLQFIFPTLAVQLARKYTKFRSIFVPLVRSDPEIMHESLYNQLDRLIVRPLLKSATSTVIVIDALDECKDEEPASAILSVLGQFVSQIPDVKFFLTGRPDPRVLRGFRLPLLAPVTKVSVLHEVKLDQVNSDMLLFFKHMFLELATRHWLVGWPGEEQLDLLCKRTAGLFVYAVATVKFIDHRNDNPEERLDRLLRMPESSVLEGKTKFNANKTLDSLYMSILQDAFGDDDPDDDHKVRSILAAVALAANPLSPSAIAELLGFNIRSVFPRLSSAHSLLILHEDIDQPVRSFHKSFPDFILNPVRCSNQRFHVSPPDHHTELLLGCLAILNRKLERNMCKLPDAIINSEVSDLKARTDKYIDQALRYACGSWYRHLVETVPARTPDITSALHQFLARKFLFWLETLSVLGAAREAVDALKVAAKWLDVRQIFSCSPPKLTFRIKVSPTLDLVNDCFHFVVTFFEVVDTSAPHIYHSALLLSPRTSIVREIYEQYTQPSSRVVQGLPTSWDSFVVTRRYQSWGDAAIAWSPCNKFVALTLFGSREIEILDATTLGRIKTLTAPPAPTRWLSFSPDSHLLTGFSNDLGLTSWDLQTGGPVGTIRPEPGTMEQRSFSSTYSADGKIVAVAYGAYAGFRTNSTISTYNLVSGSRIYSYQALGGHIVGSIWTHGERLRFATVNPGRITIWEAVFTSEHTLSEVETLPAPDNVNHSAEYLFLPTPPRLAFDFNRIVRVWDARDSKLLLDFQIVSSDWHRRKAFVFSHNGQFFACRTNGETFCVWKESPSGYTLYRVLTFKMLGSITASFSPNGESFIVQHYATIQLWHTRDPIPRLSSQSGRCTNFTLGFSPDGALAAVARFHEDTVTILDLASGRIRLTIDTGMEILWVGMAGDTVVVIGKQKIVTWKVPTSDNVFEARANIDDSIHTTLFHRSGWHPNEVAPYISISPNRNRIAVVTHKGLGRNGAVIMEVYDLPTGKCLKGTAKAKLELLPTNPWFTPDGREVWCLDEDSYGWTLMEDDDSNLTKLELLKSDMAPSGAPWQSSGYHRDMSGGWVTNASQKRVLWLPHNLRFHRAEGAWEGRFLGILSRTLPEAIILEFYE